MAVEDADDLATFFEVDEFAEAASFTPDGGSAVAVSVVTNLPRQVVGLGIAGAAQHNRSLLVRKSEVEAPDGGSFTGIVSMGSGVTYRVAEAVLDDTGKVWTCFLKR